MRVAVTVDDRELPGVIDTVRAHDDVAEAAVERLVAGVLAVGAVGLERKTPRDYVNGVMSRSGPDLYDQLERLTERCSNNSSSRREPTTKRMDGCIDGVGPELAATLYDASPSVADLLEASVTDLEALEGIGAQRARTIHAAVRGTDRQRGLGSGRFTRFATFHTVRRGGTE